MQSIILSIILYGYVLYNHATTNLALHNAKTSQDKLSITMHLQSIIVTQMYNKLHENVFTSPC